MSEVELYLDVGMMYAVLVVLCLLVMAIVVPRILGS